MRAYPVWPKNLMRHVNTTSFHFSYGLAQVCVMTQCEDQNEGIAAFPVSQPARPRRTPPLSSFWLHYYVIASLPRSSRQSPI